MEISEIYGEEVILKMIQINITVAKTRHRSLGWILTPEIE